jgi:hypothetical protein
MSRIALISVLLSVPAFVACNAPADPNATSTVTGTIALSAYRGVDNPVVISRSPSGRMFVAPVQVSGAFPLDLPSNESYRFVLASTRADRSYVGLSEIHWAGGSIWGKFPKAGSTLDFGVVRPIGSSASAPATAGLTMQDHGGGSYYGGGSGDASSGSGSSTDTSGSDSSSSAGSCAMPGEAKLPYDVKPQLGQTFRLTDAFLLEGPLPASVVNVTMDGGNWRLAELQANTPFTITQDDCSHQGNRDVGRDRVFITWTNAGGGQQTDHLDLRYCEAGDRVPDDAATAPPPAPSSGECSSTQAPLCRNGGDAMPESECTGDHMDADDHDCSYGVGGATASDYGSGGGGDDTSGDDKSHCDDDIPQCPGSAGAGGAGAAGGDSTGGSATSGGASSGASAGSSKGGGTSSSAPSGGTATSAGSVPAGGSCVVNADCAAGLACFASTCRNVIR